MINGVIRRKIWLYQKPLDFRKQMNGLIEIVAAEMEMEPNDGTIYVFRSKGKDKLKILFWDRNGFWLGYKKLEKIKFDFPTEREGKIIISWEQMYLLISGLPMTKLQIIPQKALRHFY